MSNLVKIDEEMRPWECPQTDRHTHARTDAKRFFYLTHAIIYAIAMGQIKSKTTIKIAFKLLPTIFVVHIEQSLEQACVSVCVRTITFELSDV